MGEVRVFVKVLDGDKESERELYKLLRKYRGRIVAIALVVELDKQQQGAALTRHYNLRSLQVPLSMLMGEDHH